MKVIYSPDHIYHDPKTHMYDSAFHPHPDSLKRVEVILKTLKSLSIKPNKVKTTVPESILYKIHDRNYIKFLEQICKTIKADEEFFPEMFNHNVRNVSEISLLQAKLGFYCKDTYTPVGNGTYKASIAAASVAYEAAVYLRKSKNRFVYAVCRGSGHHAERAYMCGYCYINNEAIAAEYLSQ